MNEQYVTYSEHYTRMLNERPSVQLKDFDFSTYALERPWISTLDKNSQILDIGCGFGSQIYILNALGFTHLYGIEITEESFSVAVEEVGTFSRIELIDAFEYLSTADNAYSAIFLNDVLEHIPRERTVELLTAINRALIPGGILSVRVPNMSSLLGNHSMCMDFTHVVGFTEFSLMQVFDLSGFKDHQIVHKRNRIQTRGWRPWLPLRGLGLTSIANKYLHKVLYRIRGQTPLPSVFDYNLDMWTKKY
jgi:SAM-dependent methyltransferase